MIKDLFKNKSARQQATIKGLEIAKVDFRGEFINSKHGVRVDIQSIEAIDGGVQVFARAWKGNKQLGFGKEGSVEIERFRIFNPPVMVEDSNGSYEIDYGVKNGGKRNFKEDPAGAVKQSLAHTISLIGKKDSNIKVGKIGNTVSTFYPTAGAVEPMDGFARIDLAVAGAAWATARNSGTGNFVSAAVASVRLRGGTTSNQWRTIDKGITLFDTSALTGDVVDSAIYSIYGTAANNTAAYGGLSVAIDQCSPASTSTGTATDADADNWDGVRQADTDITFASFNTSGYNDYTLNTTGEGNISLTGITKFGARSDVDLDNSEPTYATTESDISFSMADEAGTSQDPKLVVTHSTAPIVFSVSDTVNITESFTSLIRRIFTVSDTINITESITVIVRKSFTVASTLNISDILSAFRPLWIKEDKGATQTTTKESKSAGVSMSLENKGSSQTTNKEQKG